MAFVFCEKRTANARYRGINPIENIIDEEKEVFPISFSLEISLIVQKLIIACVTKRYPIMELIRAQVPNSSMERVLVTIKVKIRPEKIVNKPTKNAKRPEYCTRIPFNYLTPLN